MKKRVCILLLAFGVLSGGCSLGLPISPLLFLLKNDSPNIQQTAPASLTPADSAPAAEPSQVADANATV